MEGATLIRRKNGAASQQLQRWYRYAECRAVRCGITAAVQMNESGLIPSRIYASVSCHNYLHLACLVGQIMSKMGIHDFAFFSRDCPCLQ